MDPWPSKRPARRFAAALCFLVTLSTTRILSAQNFDAGRLPQPVQLGGVWLIHAGDDPAYARPDFDDSGWTQFDASTSAKRIFPTARPSVVWYRLHVALSPSQSGIALLERNISSAFEIYVNGRMLLRCGRVDPFAPYTYGAMLLTSIPDAETARGVLIVALRVHISRVEWGGTHPGYETSNLTIGQETALRDRMWLKALGENVLMWVVLLFGISLGIVALALYWAQPDNREYLWLFLQFAFPIPILPISTYSMFHAMPATWGLIGPALTFASDFFAILMYFAILRVRMAKWMRIFLAASGVGVIVFFVAAARQWFSLASSQIPLLPLTVFSFVVLPVVLIVEWRRGNREAPILLIPLLITGLTVYLEIIMVVLLGIPQTASTGLRMGDLLYNRHVGPLQVHAYSVCSIIYVLSLAIIIVLRSTKVSRRQAFIESELAAAQEVQRVLVPERTLAVPGFKIDCVFQPAEQVGGDFFQVLGGGDDGLLLVVGDVAGKGLPAAMLVSVLVGAIRGIAGYTRAPEEILSNLNERLAGKAGGAFSTGLAARISSDGSVAIANAGHLLPYLDGEEIELPGALPLGVVPGTQYETVRFQLLPGSRLTFFSDGVVEAQNQHRELFGFDRARKMSLQSASAIADAARQFGQCDDITVVTIEREAATVRSSPSLTAAEALPR
jgi:hypothetical protein